jgi:hypothetical protein
MLGWRNIRTKSSSVTEMRTGYSIQQYIYSTSQMKKIVTLSLGDIVIFLIELGMVPIIVPSRILQK